jgi:hypothetical protein
MILASKTVNPHVTYEEIKESAEKDEDVDSAA